MNPNLCTRRRSQALWLHPHPCPLPQVGEGVTQSPPCSLCRTWTSEYPPCSLSRTRERAGVRVLSAAWLLQIQELLALYLLRL